MATKKKVVSKKKTQKKTTVKANKLPKPLLPKDVFKECPTAQFKFTTTKNLKASHDIISQDRAVRAIDLGLGIRKPGYNIYVAGMGGTGKTSIIRTFLEKWSNKAETPSDWIYVHNFTEPEAPKAIELKTGTAYKFSKRLESAVKVLEEEIPSALQGEDYENAVNAYFSQTADQKSRMYSELEKIAKSLDFQIKSSRMGIETIPVVDGRPLTEKEYSKLSNKQRNEIEAARSKLEPEVLDFARSVRAIESETKTYVEKLQDEIGRQVIGAIIDPVILEYKHNEEIVNYLEQAKEHMLEHLLDFVEMDTSGSEEEEYLPPTAEQKDKHRKYKVNVFIDNRRHEGAPVIIETNPTYYNLFGKVEKNIELGMYLTDFTMIHAGSIHKANGGYLVLNAQDIFKTPSVWETLKRVLRNRKGFIEDMGEQFSLLPTSGLRPEPIPLDIKVILIGSDEIYHLLHEMDEDFSKIFKIKSDFDYKMPRNAKNMKSYASFIATRSKLEELLPFDKSAIASIIEYGSRIVEDQTQLTTQFGELKDLTIEADFMAREAKAKHICREHVEEALKEKFHRVSLYEEHMLEMVETNDVILDVVGSRIGQVNGLAVLDLGDYAFGKIGRITCTSTFTDDGIFNIDRASKLSGNILDKGMYILTGYLSHILGRETGLNFSASVGFEQSYGIIDGDSASIATLIAILSSAADLPVLQKFAITGSLNQFGDVQPIGGINEKIEGFYKTCQILSKSKKDEFAIIMPYQNIPNMMLNSECRKAVADKKLQVYPVKYFWEAFELATGVPLGIKTIHDQKFSPGSALDIIKKRIDKINAEHEKEHEKDHKHKEA